MTEPDLSPAALFDLEGFEWRGLLDGVAHPWRALGGPLTEYVARTLRPGIHGFVHPGAIIEGDDVEIGEGSVVEPGAYIQGPCIIGRGVEIRHGAYVRGSVLAGDGAVIGHATEVKGSIFFPGARAGHFAYVGDSILGRDVNLGAGTKLANLRLSGDEVSVSVGAARMATGLRKLGAILGDGAQTGCNSVTNPGAVLGRGARLLPCQVASGWHPAGSVIAGTGRRDA